MSADSPDVVAAAGRGGEHLARWFETAQSGLAILDGDRRVLRENAAFARVAGCGPAALVHHPSVRPALRCALEGDAPPPVVLALPEQPARRVSVTLLPLDGAVAVTVLPVSVSEIAQRTLELALESTDTGTWAWDLQTDEVRWSTNLGPLHGLERGEAPRTFAAWLDGVHPDDRDRVEAHARRAAETREGYDVEFRVAGPQPGGRWLHARAHVLCDDDGRPRTLVGVTTDITERRRRDDAARLLAEAGPILAGALEDPQATLQRLAELAVPRLADWAAVHLADEAGAPLRVAVAHRDPELQAWALAKERDHPPAPDATLGASHVFRTGRTQAIPDLSDEVLGAAGHDPGRRAMARELGLRCGIVVPLIARGRTIGSITLVQAESGRSFDDADLALAEELGRQAGIAIDNARLHHAEQEVNRRLRDLQTLTDVALTHLEVSALLQELLVRLGDLLDADLAKVLLLDEDRAALRVRASMGLAEQTAKDLSVPAGSGIAGQIAAGRRPLVISDTAHEDVVLADLKEPGRSVAGVPLVLEGETLGVLVVSSRERVYEEEDVLLLELVADRAARAIRQAELYERARDAALSLQRSLLPEALPSVEGVDVAARYVPGQAGTEVGGDWYDVFVLPDGRLAMVVGDVVGRGLRAAARMGRVRTALRAYAFEAASPADAVQRLDRLVAAEASFEFTTLVVVFLDPRTGAALACSAGHLPPLIVDRDEVRTAPVAPGPPLGVVAQPRADSPLELPANALLLAYTDGLVEDRATGLEQGVERLRAVAGRSGAARTVVDRVVAELVGERGSHDDVAIVAVGRVGGRLERMYPAEAAAVAAARHEVTSFAAAHGAPEALLQDVALAVSEACTNVVVHAYRSGERGPMRVAARRDGDGLEVRVSDDGCGVRPRRDSPGVGLGLQIITRTTEHFDVRDGPSGGAELVLRFTW